MNKDEIFKAQDDSVDKLVKLLEMQKRADYQIFLKYPGNEFPVPVQACAKSVYNMTERPELKSKLKPYIEAA